jgi:hypothetical protein
VHRDARALKSSIVDQITSQMHAQASCSARPPNPPNANALSSAGRVDARRRILITANAHACPAWRWLPLTRYSRRVETPNPYASPAADSPATAGASPELEAIRRAHLSAETNVRVVGAIAILTALLQVTVLFTVAFSLRETIVRSAVTLTMGLCGLWLLLDLRPVARHVYSALLVGLTGLAMFMTLPPAGTKSVAWIIGVVIARTFVPSLYLFALWSPRARVVFSARYRNVVMPATPRLRFRVNAFTFVVVVVFLAHDVLRLVFAIRGS